MNATQARRFQPRQPVRTVGRRQRPVAERPIAGSALAGSEIAWIIAEGRRIEDLPALTDEVGWRLVAAGLPLARMTLHIGTLHPQLFALGCRWTARDGVTEAFEVGHEARTADVFLHSPLYPVFARRETVRRRLDAAGMGNEFPILAELREAGMTEYVAMPLVVGQAGRSAATFATDRPGGFQEEEVARLSAFAPALGLVLENLALKLIARTLLDVYLGASAGGRVLAGDIARGAGEAIRAVISIYDLRDFTGLSDRLPGPRVTELLNRLFETQVAAVHRAGGEVLKFIGDGLLSIFPITDAAFTADAAGAALDAAGASRRTLAELNAELAREPDGVQLATVAALHVGEVFFGNIGGATRLDFTAVGPAVNLASRLEQVAKSVGRPLLASRDFVAACAGTRRFEPLGAHRVRGLAEPVEVFAPAA